MHLKSYQIDGRLLRTGAANFSASGLKRQDNDLIVIESPGAAASFKRNFEAFPEFFLWRLIGVLYSFAARPESSSPGDSQRWSKATPKIHRP